MAGALSPATTVLKAPYKGTTNTPTFSAVASGCATSKTFEARWAMATGMIRGSDSTSARTCQPTGVGGAGGTATSSTWEKVGIPFRVASNGSHSVGSRWTVNLTSVQFHTAGGCPKSRVNPNPPLGNSLSSLCQDSAGYSFTFSAVLMDVDNYPWYTFNSSAANSYFSAGWENYTYCYNYGTPTCSNYTGATGAVYGTGSNDPGFSKFTFNGSTTFTLWNNGTKMVATDHYLMVVTLGLSATSYASVFFLKTLWKAHANAAINMATPGNGATLNSLTII